MTTCRARPISATRSAGKSGASSPDPASPPPVNTAPRFYCINLARAVERRALMRREWIDRRGFVLEWIEAVDRRDVEIAGSPVPYDERRAKKHLGRGLTSGE